MVTAAHALSLLSPVAVLQRPEGAPVACRGFAEAAGYALGLGDDPQRHIINQQVQGALQDYQGAIQKKS